ncbi:MAG: gamma-glutamyl kinase [Pseudomonadota bacterium]|jgi:glutamate 5-kinase
MKRRVVLKIGSAVLTKAGKLSLERLENLVEFVVKLRDKYEVLIVTSGAVATGHTILPELTNKTTASKQALAAVGQAQLIHNYQNAFQKYGVAVAQILITADDFESIKRSENAKSAIATLLEYGVAPIINENDTVIVDEILRGDNDQLSAQVAHYFDAELLVILSDIEGYFDKDPNKYSDASLRKIVSHISDLELGAQNCPNDEFATGGIVTKLKAANFLLLKGRKMFLTSGFDLTSAQEFLLNNNHTKGTLFCA